MAYTHVLFDADNTLLDFTACETEILAWMEREWSLPAEAPDGTPIAEAYREINGQLWHDYERKLVTPAFLRVERFRRLLVRLGLEVRAPRDASTLNDAFIGRLQRCGALVPGAMPIIERYAPITIVTNGFASVQRSRVRAAGIEHLVGRLFISEEVGTAKPDPRFFDPVLSALDGSDRSDILVVGDSLTSDVQGGSNVGIATCWFDRDDRGVVPPDRTAPTHRITSLGELPGVIGR